MTTYLAPEILGSSAPEDYLHQAVVAAGLHDVHVLWSYVPPRFFRGYCRVVRPSRPAAETSPALALAVLSAIVDQRTADHPYYEDSTEQADRQSLLTGALYAIQADSIALRDD